MEDLSQELRPRETSLSPERIHFYQQQAQELFNKYGKDFDKFVKEFQPSVRRGNHLLRTRECTGYNIVSSLSNMDILSEKGLIFYNNYIRRTEHFGLLLAEMEQKELITSEQVRFGVKASKVRYRKNWEINRKDEKLETFEFISKSGKVYKGKADKTVEIVITFLPTNADQALEIVDFLLDRTDVNKKNAIKDSWNIPDIRATASLREMVKSGIGLKEVQGSVITEDKSSLIILRKGTKLADEFPEDPWITRPTSINEKFVKFLTYFRVSP